MIKDNNKIVLEHKFEIDNFTPFKIPFDEMTPTPTFSKVEKEHFMAHRATELIR